MNYKQKLKKRKKKKTHFQNTQIKMKKPNFHKKNTEYMYQKAKKVKKVPVQKLA